MIAPLIGVIALAVAIQFVYYCRSVVAAARSAEPSGHVLRVAGLEDRNAGPGDFRRFLDLAYLCPENGKDAARIRIVAIYYRSLRILYGLSHPLIPIISSFAKREQQACSHFAAVILDRRISSSRDLFLQHGANRPQ